MRIVPAYYKMRGEAATVIYPISDKIKNPKGEY
jgi:hypothetical protein